MPASFSPLAGPDGLVRLVNSSKAERGLNFWHVYLQTIRDMRAITIIPGVYILPSHNLNILYPAWAF